MEVDRLDMQTFLNTPFNHYWCNIELTSTAPSILARPMSRSEWHCIVQCSVLPSNLVCILLGISPASDCGLPTFRNPLSVPSSRAGCKVWSIILHTLHPALEDGTDMQTWSIILHTLHPALEDGTDRGFRNVGKLQSDAGEIPKRIQTRFKTSESLKSRITI